jgi:hypothetical protein
LTSFSDAAIWWKLNIFLSDVVVPKENMAIARHASRAMFNNLNQYCMGRHIREVLGLDYFCFHTGVSRRGVGGSWSSAKSVRQLAPREELDQNNINLIKHTWLE